MGGFSRGSGIWGLGKRGDLRRVDNHGHSGLAVFGLRAVEIDWVSAVHRDLEDGFLYRG